MKRYLFALLALSLSGCAAAPIDPAVMAVAQKPLECSNKAQCDLWWSRAQVWVNDNSSLRIQTATDSVISTYGTDGMYIQYDVTRLNHADGSALIRITLGCGSQTCIDGTPYVQAAKFKQFVRNAG